MKSLQSHLMLQCREFLYICSAMTPVNSNLLQEHGFICHWSPKTLASESLLYSMEVSGIEHVYSFKTETS